MPRPIPGLLLWLALLAPACALAQAGSAREQACLALIRANPARAVEEAARWRLEGGGIAARRCLGLALSADGRPAAARGEFEAAARAAAEAGDPGAARLWAMAGNAALGAGDFAGARAALDAAIAAPGAGELPAVRAQLYVDRAGAAMALRDIAAARADLDRAIALNPADAQARLLRAKLARGEGDLARARDEIAEARRLAPADAEIVAECQLIGELAADGAAARAARPEASARPF